MNYAKKIFSNIVYFILTTQNTVLGMNPFSIPQDVPIIIDEYKIEKLKKYTDNKSSKESRQFIKTIFPEDTKLPIICTSNNIHFTKIIKKEIFPNHNDLENTFSKKESPNNTAIVIAKRVDETIKTYNCIFFLRNPMILLNPILENKLFKPHKEDTIIHELIHYKLSRNKSFLYAREKDNKINSQEEEEFLVCYLTTYSLLYYKNKYLQSAIAYSYVKNSPYQTGTVAALKDIVEDKIKSCANHLIMKKIFYYNQLELVKSKDKNRRLYFPQQAFLFCKLNEMLETKLIDIEVDNEKIKAYKKTINNFYFSKKIRFGKTTQTLREVFADTIVI